jgi:hypothetical protein
MSTPTLSTGTFFILNNYSSRYIAADSSSAIGTFVSTAEALDEKNLDNNRFVVLILDGKYSFVNVANKLSLGYGEGPLWQALCHLDWEPSTVEWYQQRPW